MSDKLKAAIIGFGGMGHHHAAQYPGQPNVELVAICDIDETKLYQKNSVINLGDSGECALDRLRRYLDYESLVAGEPELDILDICLPTDIHAEYAIRAMRDGLNVLCEKPMALSLNDTAAMIKVQKETGRKLMVAQCLRFNAAYRKIAEFAKTGKQGRLIGLKMFRNSGLPNGWFRDVKRSGGALMDLHLHDADFLQHFLGMPRAVSGVGIKVYSGGIDDCQIIFDYEGIPMVTAEGSWTRGEFSTGCVAIFEHGTLKLVNGKLMLSSPDLAKPAEIALPPDDNMYFNEIAYFAAGVKGLNDLSAATPESTEDSIRLILAEVEAVENNRRVTL